MKHIPTVINPLVSRHIPAKSPNLRIRVSRAPRQFTDSVWKIVALRCGLGRGLQSSEESKIVPFLSYSSL